MEPFYPLRASSARTASWCSWRAPRRPRALLRLRLLLVVLDDVARPRAALHRAHDRRLGLGLRAAWSRSRATTATCCSTSCGAGIPVLGIEPAANVAAGRGARASRPWSRFFGARPAPSWRARHRADWSSATTCSRMFPTSTTSSPASKMLLKPGGVIDHRVSAPAALVDEVQFDTIYHEHFSYFSLSPRHASSSARAARCSTSRSCRPRRLAPRLRCHAEDPRADDEGAGALLEREREAGYGDMEMYRVRRAGETMKRAILSFFVEPRSRAEHRGLRRSREGKHPPQLLRAGNRLRRLHRRPQPAQAGPLPSGHEHPHPRSVRDRTTRPDYLFILPWNLRDEVMDQMRAIREWGGRFIARSPELGVYA